MGSREGPLRSVLLTVSSLARSKDIQTNQVRDEYIVFMTQPLWVSVDTSELSSISSGFNLDTAMIPVGAVHRRTGSMVCRLTGGSGVDMKYKGHNSCAASLKGIFQCDKTPRQSRGSFWRGVSVYAGSVPESGAVLVRGRYATRGTRRCQATGAERVAHPPSQKEHVQLN